MAREFRPDEVARLLRIFIESKTEGFRTASDKAFMLEMHRINPTEFEKLEETTWGKTRDYYLARDNDEPMVDQKKYPKRKKQKYWNRPRQTRR